MRFADALQRLDDAATNRQPGLSAETCHVRRQDLRELLHHFRRLDTDLRASATPPSSSGLSRGSAEGCQAQSPHAQAAQPVAYRWRWTDSEAWVLTRDKPDHVARVVEPLFTARPPSTLLEGVDIPRLPVGTPVTKVLGYPFPGTVVSTFHTLSGQERFVVEATGKAYRGMLHIFNGDQLRATTEGSIDA